MLQELEDLRLVRQPSANTHGGAAGRTHTAVHTHGGAATRTHMAVQPEPQVVQPEPQAVQPGEYTWRYSQEDTHIGTYTVMHTWRYSHEDTRRYSWEDTHSGTAIGHTRWYSQDIHGDTDKRTHSSTARATGGTARTHTVVQPAGHTW